MNSNATPAKTKHICTVYVDIYIYCILHRFHFLLRVEPHERGPTYNIWNYCDYGGIILQHSTFTPHPSSLPKELK